jgi:hypothetical protein
VVQAPRDGDSAVPTDALLWGYGSAFARLLGPGGEVVPTEDRAIPVALLDGNWFATSVLAPLQPLAPNANYTIEVNHNPAGTEPLIARFHFSTGPGNSAPPPALPTLVSTVRHAGGGFFSLTRAIELEFEHQGILIGDTGTLGAVSSVDDLFIEGSRPVEYDDDETPRVEWATTDRYVWVGKGDCVVWPEGASDQQIARFGVLDLAGNFSGWVDTEVELPSEAEAQEAQALAEQERAAEAAAYAPPPVFPSNDNSSACSTPPGNVSGTSALLTLGLAGVLGFARRSRRVSR